ncbi:hypothetical protein AVEN_267401-1 [Araneus ventricosus]|uniref:Uncharacterized protein n=1 Tax=Araneus ventricosus TaxID=182803 RepID=A0A4Y2VG13_ARAVE|nr:hypothetical protein AVEN_267401-1 [Araneus ventricosus]
MDIRGRKCIRPKPPIGRSSDLTASVELFCSPCDASIGNRAQRLSCISVVVYVPSIMGIDWIYRPQARSELQESRTKTMAELACFDCFTTYNSLIGHHCLNGWWIPGVANGHATAQAVTEELDSSQQGSSHGPCVQINET